MSEIEKAHKTFKILDQLPVGNFVINEDYVVLFWNFCLEKWMKLDRDKIVGDKIYKHFPQLRGSEFSQPLRQIFEGGPPVIFSSERHNHTAPSCLWDKGPCLQKTTVTAVPASKGSGFYALFTVEDVKGQTRHITGQKIMRNHALLETEQRGKTEEKLKNLVNELQQSNRNLREFAYIASHDLQEPLRKIVSFGGLLRKYQKHLNGQGKDYLERIVKSATRMQNFIHDLLELSRVTTEAKSFGRTDLNKAASEALSDLEIRLQQSKGKVDIAKLPSLEANAFQMRQLFLNLINNALKFHRQGIPPQISIYGRKNGNGTWIIIIKDNGIGFKMKYADQIFNCFERLNGHNRYEGNGMGLAICRKIVERHKGTITVESIPQKGTTFIITLPEKQRPS